jgi:hypothetical protein
VVRDRGPRRVVTADRNRRGNIRRNGRRFVWGPGVTFWLYDGSYYGDCAWLRRQAIRTGSSYWWRRFNRCRAW